MEGFYQTIISYLHELNCMLGKQVSHDSLLSDLTRKLVSQRAGTGQQEDGLTLLHETLSVPSNKYGMEVLNQDFGTGMKDKDTKSLGDSDV